jgi:phospholipid/cholesterol/gamma-HCH transport system permease protein
MNSLSVAPATITQSLPQEITLAGAWTVRGIVSIDQQLGAIYASKKSEIVINGAGIDAFDTAGAWVMQKLLRLLNSEGNSIQVRGLRPEFAKLLEVVGQKVTDQKDTPSAVVIAPLSALQGLGRSVALVFGQVFALFSFIGECALAFAGCVAHPTRIRWRPILYNIRSAGFDALPIVGLLSFMLGIVVAYQGADQLRKYGANIFVADLIGLSMLREFAPLITAIIIAGRSGSAYAAQIGSMSVTEEIDAMYTLGIEPLELLVLPKILALLIALPLLIVFADALGVFGGMIMAHAQLGVGYNEFLDRFVKAVSVKAFLIGICKAPVFAAIIAVVGCFQGFRTRGGADNVGHQTTRSVVQSIFLVIVADALFSVAFSALGL